MHACHSENISTAKLKYLFSAVYRVCFFQKTSDPINQKMKILNPEPFWPTILATTIICGGLVLLALIFLPAAFWLITPFITLIGLFAIFFSRFGKRNCLYVDKVTFTKDRMIIITKQKEQYELPYVDILKIKLVTIPAKLTSMDYISLKTTAGSLRLNVLGERLKKQGLTYGNYKSGNAAVYSQLKEVWGKQKP